MFTDHEQTIIDRLTAGLPDGVKVMQQAEYDQTEAKALRQHAPFVAVIYDGFTPVETIANGKIVKIHHEWHILVGAKSAAGKGRNLGARDRVSDIVARVLELLAGFHLGGGAYLRLTETPGPVYESGYCYQPLSFASPAQIRGTD